MGMPIIVEIIDDFVNNDAFDKVFSYFQYIDGKFSTYKKTSDITKINDGKINKNDYSQDIKTIFLLAEKTKRETEGYFDISQNGKIDPSGIVKGLAIFNAAKILKKKGFRNFYIDAGGDIQTSGINKHGKHWKIGIKNPFNKQAIIKVIYVNGEGVATSGTYERGRHIYNPKLKNHKIDEIVSLSVVGPNIYEADRFATAAFAMSKKGIEFIEGLSGFEGYLIDENGKATMTSGFEKYTKES